MSLMLKVLYALEHLEVWLLAYYAVDTLKRNKISSSFVSPHEQAEDSIIYSGCCLDYPPGVQHAISLLEIFLTS